MEQQNQSLALQQAFLNARSFNKFQDKAIPEELIHKLYDVLKWGPTSMNSQPARFVFIQSAEAKQKLLPTLMESNQEKTKQAPLTVIVAQDMQFYQNIKQQFPAYDATELFASNVSLAESTAFRNSSLQGGYLIIAARLLGLDVGVMSGFNPQAVNEAFFPEGRWQVNFIANIGYGDESGNHPRGPRLSFDEVAKIL
ncbi:malonic semialdehyde reductase [Pseudobdellovibrio exovorus]|uniref:Nitroreductase domain-containing protein n=1 Tax=Pseudobdellovibrio exovorus JSS TaxID=1184267 RepID=M4V937_9BACT|nr:malonic semialdehyde reductase [Pseudobdellovibrio exovorus]AGH94516.1 hypothetical protein A11Q_296 [Pseudobdellovibrio exovorus JSS]